MIDNSYLMRRLQQNLFFFSVILLSACSTDGDVKPKNVTLIKATKINSYTAVELRFLISLSGLDIPSSLLLYDVDVYKVTYNTEYKGSVITASGIVSLPKTENTISMVSLHHGTIVTNDEAPSEQSSSGESMILFAALASPGFIAVVPDYIGFGSSAHILHPYYVEDYTASAIIDNLKAAKELATNKGLDFNEELFLTGYSEGGYATMATHKSIEEDGLDGFNLIASFPAAGGYDVKGMQEYVFSLDSYDEPYYLAYVSLAYQTTYNWIQPLTNLFNEPYASFIPDLFDGTNSREIINASLSDDISVLVNNDLLISADTDPQYEYFVSALELNSLTNWVPTVKMFMYHGDADTTVPYQNSIDAYEQLLANGASPNTVKFITLSGGTHFSGVQPYIEDLVPKLLELASVSD